MFTINDFIFYVSGMAELFYWAFTLLSLGVRCLSGECSGIRLSILTLPFVGDSILSWHTLVTLSRAILFTSVNRLLNCKYPRVVSYSNISLIVCLCLA